MGIHNRYLPNWVHRIFNGLFAFFLNATIGVLGWVYFRNQTVICEISKGLIYLSIPIGIFVFFLNPKRISLVEGLAGVDGYDELIDDHDQKKPRI
jgi:TRAP-type C4-dicarboxylate transport system permease small subunit